MPNQNKKQIYNLTPDEALEKFKSGRKGIEDAQAKTQLKVYGRNVIERRQNWKIPRLVFGQFNDALVWILLVAAALAFYFHEYRDTTIILIIVGINATIGFFQEFKAERILDSLRKLTTDKTLVIRGGKKREIDTKEIVPGDIISVTSGDNIPADGYILEAYDLRINSFIFTGESKPKSRSAHIIEEQDVALPDINNMVFMGETVAVGEAIFLVTNTGMTTELGRIAHLTQEVSDSLTPMQRQMRKLGRDVTIISLFIGAVVLVAGQYFKMSLYQNFLFALALSVSVVPEGLPAAISVALSLGMKRLLKDNVLSKKLNAVETLGSVSIICTDKTGTITKNELTVTELVVNNKTLTLEGIGYDPRGNFYQNGEKINPKEIPNLELLMKIGTLANDATLVHTAGCYKIIGDPTEGAIIVAGRKYEHQENFYNYGEQKTGENPFSSERMRMSVIFSAKGGSASGGKNSKTISYVKGSPDVMINLCSTVQIGNELRPFTENEKAAARAKYNEMSSRALRVLAFAYRDLSGTESNLKKPAVAKALVEEAEKNLTWVGMMAMIDPPREDVGKAIGECKKLGINPIMITGDYEVTARAIAKNVGLTDDQNNKEAVINGQTLNTLGDRELYQKIRSGACVFARIAPEQKLRIATVLKKYGEVIAMTGDGVNDAPALKRADIGVAMGIMGTDVSKEASDMILLDDNFASIVKGVREGRTIFQNLKKFVHYVLTSNASELFTVILGVILQIPAPVSAIQILAVDLGTDVFPSFALGLEPPEPDKKDLRKELNSKNSVISLQGFRRILYLGIIMATGAVIAFIWSMLRGGWHFGDKMAIGSLLYIKSTTAAYAVLSMTQMANLLQSRSEKLSPFKLGFFKNKYAIGAIFLSFLILLGFMYLPFCQKYLGMLPIDSKDWLVVFVSFLAVFLWEEIRKKEL